MEIAWKLHGVLIVHSIDYFTQVRVTRLLEFVRAALEGISESRSSLQMNENGSDGLSSSCVSGFTLSVVNYLNCS